MSEDAPRQRGRRGETARPPRRLSVEAVKSLQPGAREYTVWDTLVPRFGVRVYTTGARLYVLRLRIDGRQRWMTIGRHGDPWTPDMARSKALELLGATAQGKDPARERETGKATPTLAEFAERYIEDYSQPHKKRASFVGDLSLLGLVAAPEGSIRKWERNDNPRTILEALGEMRIDKVERADVTRLHLAWKETPTRANRALALLSHMFTMAEKWGLRPDNTNPCRHVARFKEARRERFLSPAELAQLGDAIATLSQRSTLSPFALAAVRLLVFTGMRAGEVLGLTWERVNVGNGTVRLADSKTGAKTVYLGAPALRVLAQLPRVADNPFVIVGANAGAPLTLWGLEQVWQRVRTTAGLPDVRLHDLRHSFASVAAARGQSLTVIGALLGHSHVETTNRYAHLAADPLRAASDAVALEIAAAMEPNAPK